MSDEQLDPPIEITNCHIHLFTTKHSPRYFPFRLVVIFRRFPWIVRFLRWLSSFLPYTWLYEWMVRLEAFHATGSRKDQEAVLKEVMHYYPSSARFVVLPMDMKLIGYGPVEEDIREQHEELARLSRNDRYRGKLIPFATIYPGREGAVAEFRKRIEEDRFRGLKLYPKLGYMPDDDLLMREVYPYCEEHGLPVLSHCSRGGVGHADWDQYRRDRATEPGAFVPVLTEFPELRVNLAHFGGEADWRSYLTDGFDPDDPKARARNWVSRIVDMITDPEERFANLYTDISYTIFKFGDYNPLLRLFLDDPKLYERILFGSDFYMTRQERLSEKAVSIRLRDALGEDKFRQIAEVNPRRWLGEPQRKPG